MDRRNALEDHRLAWHRRAGEAAFELGQGRERGLLVDADADAVPSLVDVEQDDVGAGEEVGQSVLEADQLEVAVVALEDVDLGTRDKGEAEAAAGSVRKTLGTPSAS